VLRPHTSSKPVSIKDIARIANVSHSTVSRALRNSPLVHPSTAEQIRKIASESGYRASAVARSLVNRRTHTIGVVVTTIADPFNGEVVSGIEDKANHLGYSVFLANSKSEPERELRVVHSFEERRVDGIIVTSSRVGAHYADLLERMNIPVVFLNNHNPGNFAYSVSIDDGNGAREATNHLLDLGHTRIGYIGDEFGLRSNENRLSGFRGALRSRGVKEHAEAMESGDGSCAEGAAAMERILKRTPLPTAVFCYNDQTALGAMSALHARGIRIPEEISVVGFDDLPAASYASPPLTTVRQPMEQMGRRAMEILAGLLSGETAGIEGVEKFDGELIVRRSTASPKK